MLFPIRMLLHTPSRYVCFAPPPSDQVSPPARGGGEGSSSSAVIRARRPRRALRCSAPVRARAPAAHRQRAQRAVGPSPRTPCATAPPTHPEPPSCVGRLDASRPTRCVWGGGPPGATEVGRGGVAGAGGPWLTALTTVARQPLAAPAPFAGFKFCHSGPGGVVTDGLGAPQPVGDKTLGQGSLCGGTSHTPPPPDQPSEGACAFIGTGRGTPPRHRIDADVGAAAVAYAALSGGLVGHPHLGVASQFACCMFGVCARGASRAPPRPVCGWGGRCRGGEGMCVCGCAA